MNTNHKRVKCRFCSKEITVQAIVSHENACQRPKIVNDGRYHLDHDGLNCKFCDKLCKNSRALVQHEVRCIKNPECKDVFKEGLNKFTITKSKAKCPTRGKICITNGYRNTYIYPDEEIPEGWHKGNFYRPVVGNFTGKTHTSETRKNIGEKVSKSRLKGIAEGKIIPNTSKRFVRSYIEYKDGTKQMLRSSYELIIAIFLDICGIYFTYEKIRAAYTDTDDGQHTFISDFAISDKILEVKGREYSQKLIAEAKAFSQIGYELRVIHEKDVFRIRSLLANLIDINSILAEAKEKSKNETYFTYKLNF